MSKEHILDIENIASFEKLINRDKTAYDINLMVMPGTLQDKHKNVDPKKGIQALRRQFNLIYLLLEGEHDVQLGATYTWLKPNDLVVVPEYMVYASNHIKNCSGYCIHFKTEFLRPLLNDHLETVFPYFSLEAEHIINISPKESKIIQKAFKDIIIEYGRFSPEKDYLLRNYIHILLLRIREIYRPYSNLFHEKLSHSMRIANNFKHLLEKNFMETREIKQYASLLNITPKHLSDVVKSTFGKTPRQMINGLLLLEAKVLLGSTDLSLSEIAFKLHFNDASHFSHFVRKQTGHSPIELRKMI